MFIRIGYDITVRLSAPTAVIYLLRIHPSRSGDLVLPENFQIQPELPVEEYWDKFSNLCGRLNAPAGDVRFLNEAIVRDTGELDAYAPEAAQYDVQELPPEMLTFLLPSRFSRRACVVVLPL
jgi:hypothetical protein